MLVPIDASDLSIEVVGSAVAMAHSVGARVTFFHALPHAAPATGGRAGELLAKAEAAARAFGVPCASHWRTGDRPAAAIVAAARERQCDLIVMAAHGPSGDPGRAQASETLAVLMSAGLPVLVTHTGEPAPPARAIGILRDEHRAMAAVLHAWMHALSTARAHAVLPDIAAMQAMLRYLQGFPAVLHHPKEETQLFRRLRERSPAAGVELDELERQHRRDAELLAGLGRHLEALIRAVAGGMAGEAAAAVVALERAVQAYAAFLWDHLGREEAVILPAAQRCLTADDWLQIDAAFARERAAGEGRADIAREYHHLFACIVDADQALH